MTWLIVAFLVVNMISTGCFLRAAQLQMRALRANPPISWSVTVDAGTVTGRAETAEQAAAAICRVREEFGRRTP